jgi:hypothetical protein
MSVTGGALHPGRSGETIAVAFSTELTCFDVDNVAVKILLMFGFVGNMALALFAGVG